MKTHHRFLRRTGVILLLVAGLAMVLVVRAQPAHPVAAVPADRTAEQVQKDLEAAGEELDKVMPDLIILIDPANRSELAPKVIPPMKKVVGFMEELGQLDGTARSRLSIMRLQLRAFLSFLGDMQTTESVRRGIKDIDAAEARQAQDSRLLADWWASGGSVAAQEKLIAELTGLVEANAKERDVAIVANMISQKGAANRPIQEKIESLLLNRLAEQIGEEGVARIHMAQKVRGLEGKPITIEGMTVDGKPFSSAAWKGKVVLVNFWATWCPPCRAELPHIIELYEKYHDQGLEIVGVSNDRSTEALMEFLAANPKLAWPQIFDVAHPGWNAVAAKFSVDPIPTIFLIDRKGIVRTVDGVDKYQRLVPEMLAEKVE